MRIGERGKEGISEVPMVILAPHLYDSLYITPCVQFVDSSWNLIYPVKVHSDAKIEIHGSFLFFNGGLFELLLNQPLMIFQIYESSTRERFMLLLN